MGNQGMTNWKFSAFLAIALMLVAGLLTSTAMATDGHGTIMVEELAVVADGNAIVIEQHVDSSETDPFKPAIVSANGGGLQLDFMYTAAAAVNMQDGMIQIEISPDDGWTVPAAGVSVVSEEGNNVGGAAITALTGDDARLIVTKKWR